MSEFIAVMLFAALVGLFCFVKGGAIVFDAKEKEAASHGCAEYVVDQKTGETEFRWKDEAPNDPQ